MYSHINKYTQHTRQIPLSHCQPCLPTNPKVVDFIMVFSIFTELSNDPETHPQAKFQLIFKLRRLDEERFKV